MKNGSISAYYQGRRHRGGCGGYVPQVGETGEGGGDIPPEIAELLIFLTGI